MKKFNFRLEKVLNYKALRLKQQQKEHANAVNVRLEAEKILAQKRTACQAFADNMLIESQASAGQLNQRYEYYNQLLAEAEHHQQEVRRLMVEEECARQALENIHQEEKALKTLKDRELESFFQKRAAEEQAQLDEIAVMNKA